jgi:hypothetical protein
MPAPSGIDETLKLEAIYLSAPIPRNFAVLTAMGAIFDKVHFPGVYLPQDGFDIQELDKEITRLNALPRDARGNRPLLLGVLNLTKHAKTLAGFCEFTAADPNDVLDDKSQPPEHLVRAIYDAIHGPPRPGFTPGPFHWGHAKALPGGDEQVRYPSTYNYLARAIIHSGKTGIPLLNDSPYLKLPGMIDAAPPEDDAKLLAAFLAVECTRIVLPPTPVLRPEDMMEFREANAPLLRAFRRSMLRYAADLNNKIKDITLEEFEAKTKFFIETERNDE